MNQDKLDRWGDKSGPDRDQAAYSDDMARIQEAKQAESLRRLDERLQTKGKS